MLFEAGEACCRRRRRFASSIVPAASFSTGMRSALSARLAQSWWYMRNRALRDPRAGLGCARCSPESLEHESGKRWRRTVRSHQAPPAPKRLSLAICVAKPSARREQAGESRTRNGVGKERRVREPSAETKRHRRGRRLSAGFPARAAQDLSVGVRRLRFRTYGWWRQLFRGQCERLGGTRASRISDASSTGDPDDDRELRAQMYACWMRGQTRSRADGGYGR